MKNLIFKLVLPLTIISFSIFTKSWYAVVIDGTDQVMYGFPLIYTTKGFHTSLSSQYFIFELIIDIVTYFLFWIFITYLVDRFLFKLKLHKVVVYILMGITVIIITFSIFDMSWHENSFYFKRNFEIKIAGTEYKFIWQRENENIFRKY